MLVYNVSNPAVAPPRGSVANSDEPPINSIDPADDADPPSKLSMFWFSVSDKALYFYIFT